LTSSAVSVLLALIVTLIGSSIVAVQPARFCQLPDRTIHHAGALALPVGTLVITVIETALVGRLVLAPRPTLRVPRCLLGAATRAVFANARARGARQKLMAAQAARNSPQNLLHAALRQRLQETCAYRADCETRPLSARAPQVRPM
jgi:hypothetical protein